MQRDRAAFFLSLVVILNIVVTSDSSDLHFEGFLEGSDNTTLSTVTATSALMKIFLTVLIMTRTFRKNTVISVLFTKDMKFFFCILQHIYISYAACIR